MIVQPSNSINNSTSSNMATAVPGSELAAVTSLNSKCLGELSPENSSAACNSRKLQEQHPFFFQSTLSKIQTPMILKISIMFQHFPSFFQHFPGEFWPFCPIFCPISSHLLERHGAASGFDPSLFGGVIRPRWTLFDHRCSTENIYKFWGVNMI